MVACLHARNFDCLFVSNGLQTTLNTKRLISVGWHINFFHITSSLQMKTYFFFILARNGDITEGSAVQHVVQLITQNRSIEAIFLMDRDTELIFQVL